MTDAPSCTTRLVPLASLICGRNPRTYFDEGEMRELVDSVRASGIAQAILVRPLADGQYRIVAGERRVRAARVVFGENGSIPALVRACSDEEEEILALIENVDRAQMSGAEEAQAAQRLLQRSKGDKAEVAARLGWTMLKLNRRLALLHLSSECQDALTKRQISLGHAELLATVPAGKQNAALAKIIEHAVSVADLKRQVGALANDLGTACFDRAGCAQCHYNSAQQRALFSEVVDGGVCTNPPCFAQKSEAHLEALRGTLSEEAPKVVILRTDSAEQPVRLCADGKAGVGEAQMAACKSCANHGLSVSALPGSMGEVERGLCFDAACHVKKVAAHLKALRGSVAASQGKSGAEVVAPKQTSASLAHGVNTSSKTKAAPDAIPSKVKEYRDAQWRLIAARFVWGSKERGAVVLAAIGLAGHGRCVDAAKASRVLAELAGSASGGKGYGIESWLGQVRGLPQPQVHRLLDGMAASAFQALPMEVVCGVLAHFAVNVSDYWQLNKEYLALLTKSELEALAGELGLAEAMGKDGLRKALAGKKDALLGALLGVDGFDYSTAVPAQMQWKRAADAVSVRDADESDAASPDGEATEAESETEAVEAVA